MGSDFDSFSEFMKRRKDAASSYVNGDSSRLSKLVTHADPATFFAPGGEILRDAELIDARYQQDAIGFVSGSTHLDILDINASDAIAYWVGIQNATVRLHGKDDPVDFVLRVSEIFRRENDGWKLVHRHASPATAKSA